MSYRRLFVLFVALACVVLFTASCGTGGSRVCANGNCEEVEDAGGTFVMTCSTSADCDGGYTCLDDICVAEIDGCVSTNDCEVGLLCDTATASCVECLNDGQCNAGQVCDAGFCSETVIAGDDGDDGSTDPADEAGGPGEDTVGATGTSCASDSDCSYGRCEPVSGVCVDCLSESDCPSGYDCDANICIPSSGGPDGDGSGGGLGDLLGGGGAPVACTSQADCDASCTVCNLATQVCESCSNAVACVNGLQCLDGAASGLPIGSYCVDDPNDFSSALSCLGGGGLPGFP